MPHIKIVDDDRLPLSENPAHQPLARGYAYFLHKRFFVGRREGDRTVSGLVREKQDGAVRIKGSADQRQQGIFVIVQGYHESLFKRMVSVVV